MKVIVLDGHPREEELAAYVSDTLSPTRAERLEAHVFDCPRCAALLQEAASFQMLLHETADAFEAEQAAPPSLVRRIGRRVGAVSGLWAAAAVLAVMIMGPGSHEQVPVMTLDDEGQTTVAVSEGFDIACDPSDIDCAEALLASVDPLESVDPLSSWPDDPLVRSGFAEAEPLDGEPCGSGEDGGPLVCPTNDDPFSG